MLYFHIGDTWHHAGEFRRWVLSADGSQLVGFLAGLQGPEAKVKLDARKEKGQAILAWLATVSVDLDKK